MVWEKEGTDMRRRWKGNAMLTGVCVRDRVSGRMRGGLCESRCGLVAASVV